MKEIIKKELNIILEQHKLWLEDETKGKRADLNGANLSGFDLSVFDLRNADLRNAHLRYAHLRYADFSGANLSGANLRDANLGYANLSGANLSGANLSGANLSGANLSGANLTGVDLDFSSLPLWSGGLDFKVDEKILKQLMYHVLSIINYNDIDYKDIIKKVNTSHLVTEYELKQINLKD